jgi:hypothetical protein
MSHTKTAGGQIASHPTGRLTPSQARPRTDVSQQVARSALSKAAHGSNLQQPEGAPRCSSSDRTPSAQVVGSRLARGGRALQKVHDGVELLVGVVLADLPESGVHPVEEAIELALPIGRGSN